MIGEFLQWCAFSLKVKTCLYINRERGGGGGGRKEGRDEGRREGGRE